MKSPTKSMLQADAILQGILIVPMLIAYLVAVVNWEASSTMIALFLQFFLGCFQLLSALTRRIRHGSKIRSKYLLVAVGYVIALIIGGTILSEVMNVTLIILFLIAIPTIMGCSYWALTIMQASGNFVERQEDKSQNLSTLALEDDEDAVIDNILIRHKKRIKT